MLGLVEYAESFLLPIKTEVLMHARSGLPFLRACFGLLLVLGTLAALLPQPVHAAGPKVVYHADFSDPRRFSAMLTSINNMVMHYNNELVDYDVRIVFLSHGIRFVTDDPLRNTPFVEDKALKAQRENLRGRLMTLASLHNVKLELCDITRTQVNLDKGKLYAPVTLVPSGVVRIAQLQNDEGFAYIKVE
jgi:intracellular sulfur oxidation DsrE/DsrF family protein